MEAKLVRNYMAVTVSSLVLSLSPYKPECPVMEPAVSSPVSSTALSLQNDALPLLQDMCPALENGTEVAAALREAAESHQVDEQLLTAIMVAESQCRAKARSRAGAKGLMQLMPGTAKWLGVNNPYSPRESVLAGAKYLSMLIRDFNGNIELALAAYNCGPENVRRFRGVPPYKETVKYVRKVLNHYQTIQQSAST